MGTASVFQSFSGVCSGPSSHFCAQSGISISDGPNYVRFGSKSWVSTASAKQYRSVSNLNMRQRREAFGSRKCSKIRASSSDALEPAAPFAPLQLESPVGQLLSQILVSHPHLVPAAVEQQLEQLQTDRDAEKIKGEPSASATDLVLSRRIAEVKATERKKALEEILYAMIVQKFMEADVSLIPTIKSSSSDPSGRVDTWPTEDDKLGSLHSPDAYEMIQNHLTLILGNRLGDSTSVAQINKLRVGQVYAASVMYGYFLKRVDQRFQLEKAMKILPRGVAVEEIEHKPFQEEMGPNGIGKGDSLKSGQSHPEVSSWASDISSPGVFGSGIKSSRLRTYVMSFEGETIQRYATIRSKEAVAVVENQTEALFGRPEIVITPEGTVDSSKDELIKISFGGLRGLVLEAVTFGSFLWDVESYVDSRYHFV